MKLDFVPESEEPARQSEQAAKFKEVYDEQESYDEDVEEISEGTLHWIEQEAQSKMNASFTSSAHNDSDHSEEEEQPRLSMSFLANERERVSNAKTALFEAAQQVSCEKIKQAVRNGASINAKDESMCMWTALHYAAENGSVPAMRTCLKLGANISEKSIHGQTPLHVAACEGNMEAVKYLLRKGMPVDERNLFEYTALHIAASRGNLDLARVLLDSGADLNALTMHGNNVINLAATQGHDMLISVLIKLGADVNNSNVQNRTALHHAALQNEEQTVRVLLDAGITVNHANEEGNTALHEAARMGFVDTVETILSNAKPDIFIVNHQNQTAMEYARVAGEGLCASVLWNKMGLPLGKLEVPPRPKTKEELDDEFIEMFWKSYCDHRTEPSLPGVKKCCTIDEWLDAINRVQGYEEPPVKPEDNFVIRKGLRVYLDSDKKPVKQIQFPSQPPDHGQ